MNSPSVLFVCVKNGGKSQMAAALMRQIAGESVTVHSAGTQPGPVLNEESKASVEEVGASMDGEHPKPIDPALLDSVSRVVLLGTEAVIDRPGLAPVEVWETDEPSTRGIDGTERMRLIREDITRRVTDLALEL
ncbi:MAG: low molecular weight phosphatase family protein, partial [Dermatophilaceae bacterium]